MMDWSNERWVRVYTRDTVTWQLLSFDAKAMLCLLLRKCDRSGRIALGGRGLRVLGAVVGHTDLWEPRLRLAVDELLAEGVAIEDAGDLLFPRFLEAQEARSSEAERKRRQRAMAEAMSQNGTNCPESTDGPDKKSRLSPQPTNQPNQPNQPATQTDPTAKAASVSASSAAPSPPPAQQTLLVENRQPVPVKQKGRGKSPAAKDPSPDEVAVFEHWRQTLGKRSDTLLSDGRLGFIRDRLGEGYTVERLKLAIDGVLKDDWEDRHKHDDLPTVLRDAIQVDKFLALAVGTPTKSNDAGASAPDAAPGVNKTLGRLAKMRSGGASPDQPPAKPIATEAA
jgi:hypothetical protein